jgi:hypothetical protein
MERLLFILLKMRILAAIAGFICYSIVAWFMHGAEIYLSAPDKDGHREILGKNYQRVLPASLGVNTSLIVLTLLRQRRQPAVVMA